MSDLETVLEDSPRAANSVKTEDVFHCVKLLVCISTYLSVFEQSDAKPFAWLNDLLLQVLTQLDEMIPEPPVGNLTELLGSFDSDGIVKYATERVCQILTLRRREFQDVLWDMVEAEHDFRNEILVMALSESLEKLHEHAALFP
ncbi:hypothetical protein BH10CYA1_BH10CYA1_30510 [soil metagenome]